MHRIATAIAPRMRFALQPTLTLRAPKGVGILRSQTQLARTGLLQSE